MNSIQKKLTPESYIAKFTLFINSYPINNKTLIIVEGPDDELLYKKMFRNDSTFVNNVGGVSNLQEVVKKLYDKYKKGFIAIKDADFDTLEKRKIQFDNLFKTDTHDQETMLINNESVSSIVYESLRNKKSNYDFNKEFKDVSEFINFLSKSLYNVSCIKWYNDVNSCNINFECVKITDLFDNTNPIDTNTFLEKLYENRCNLGPNVKNINTSQIKDFMTKKECDNIMLLVNGHDFCTLFASWIKFKNGGSNNQVNADSIASNLRLQYNKTQFMTTKLCKSINRWEINNNRNLT